MASHSYIIAAEERLIAARADVADLARAYDVECAANVDRYEHNAAWNGRPSRDNYALWQTCLVNASVLKKELDNLLDLARRKPPVKP